MPEADINSQRAIGLDKSSLSAALELAPNQGELNFEEADSDPVPEGTFLKARTFPSKGIISSSYGPHKQKSRNFTSRLATRKITLHSRPRDRG